MGSIDTAEVSVHGVFAGCHARMRWAELAIRELQESSVPGGRTALDASNIVHQLWSTLDNLVWQLVAANGGTKSPSANAFPVYKVDSRKRRAKLARRLTGVAPHHIEAIEGVQPWTWPRPSEHPLAILDALASADELDVLTFQDDREMVATLRQSLGCVEGIVRAFQLSIRSGRPPVLTINETTVMQWTEAIRMRDLTATRADDTALVQRFGRTLTSADLGPFDESDLVHVLTAIQRLLNAPVDGETERLVVLERAISQELALRKVARFQADRPG